MIIIHAMNDSHILPRWVTAALEARLQVMPVVVVTGARQTGKSTLVRHLLSAQRAYYTLDDLDLVDLATNNPAVLLSGTMPITIDEVQRVPQLLHAIKRAVDEDRTPGRFLLSGSANLLLMSSISESLAGRAAYLTLRPLTRGEQTGRNTPSLWGTLLDTDASQWVEVVQSAPRERVDWASLACRGGFPTPATALAEPSGRAIWFDGYVRTYLERDLLALSSVSSLPDFRRLMRVAASRVGRMLNQTELGRSVGLPQPTVHRYLNLMETSYLIVRLPPYTAHPTKRVVKTPKLYWGDTGLALHLSRQQRPDGFHLENQILTDLLASQDAGAPIDEVYYWRTRTGAEVDFVLASRGMLLPIEVKSTATPRIRDAKGLNAFLEAYPGSSRHGLLLHTGEAVQWLTPQVLAVPWWRIL